MWLDFLDDILPATLNPSLKLFIHVLIVIQVLAFLLYLATLIFSRYMLPKELPQPQPQPGPVPAASPVEKVASPVSRTKKEK